MREREIRPAARLKGKGAMLANYLAGSKAEALQVCESERFARFVQPNPLNRFCYETTAAEVRSIEGSPYDLFKTVSQGFSRRLDVNPQ